MSETTSSSEPATGPIEPVATPPAPQPVVVRQSSRVTQVAAWVGIVAGVVFIVGAIFFSGFVLGAHSGHGGRHHGGGGPEISMHRQGPPPMFPGPMMRPGPGFVFPGGPGGFPGDHGFEGRQSPESPTPSTPNAPR
ncbi:MULTISPECIES: hypothetical protein [unclassified Mycobacterium]|uniref:hypothetical protein n=1 Tax=unclassified Mycobacterium TaxID=2642494 RepID=UPI0029C71D8B|nr:MULTISPECIES: hypothetical protein [unclassified Mycobacterium]